MEGRHAIQPTNPLILDTNANPYFLLELCQLFIFML